MKTEEMQEQFMECVKALGKWRDDRKISVLQQRDGFIKNFTEEAVEYCYAKTPEDKIDALCDMAVITLNMINSDDVINLNTMRAISFNTLRALYNGIPYFDSPYYVMSLIRHIISLKGKIELEKIEELILAIFSHILYLGYEPTTALMETIKEISDRKGEFNELEKKWIKYPCAYDSKDLFDKHLDKINNAYPVLVRNYNLLKEAGQLENSFFDAVDAGFLTRNRKGVNKWIFRGSETDNVIKELTVYKVYKADYNKAKMV